MIRVCWAVLLLGACNEICDEEATPGIAASSGTARGSVELQAADGASNIAFATSFEGDVSDDGSRAVALTISEGSAFVEIDIPDLRALHGAAAVTVPADGSITVDGGFCNFSGGGTLTIEQAAGSIAPAPQFVTAGFHRTADLVLDIDTFASGAVANGPLPACPSRLVLHGTLELTADSYSAVEHAVNCPDLSK